MGKLGVPALTGMVAVSLSACASGGVQDAPEMAAYEQPTYWAQTEPKYNTDTQHFISNKYIIKSCGPPRRMPCWACAAPKSLVIC